jgi:hypothetical protein
LPEDWLAPAYWQIHLPQAVRAAALSVRSLATLLGRAELESTEGYVLVPRMEGIATQPGLFHYNAVEHELEQRAELPEQDWGRLESTCPGLLFVVGLSSIHRQETWKYGERGFRTAQQEVGHTLARLRLAAAALGWKLSLLPARGDAAMSALLGLDRDADYERAERETPNLVVAVSAGLSAPEQGALDGLSKALCRLQAQSWVGHANALNSTAGVAWPVLDEVTRATAGVAPVDAGEDFSHSPAPADLYTASSKTGSASVEQARPADKDERSVSAETFFHLLARLVPTRDRKSIPWDAIAWKPRIHIGLIVHRVRGVSPGLYALCRDPDQTERLRGALRSDALWHRERKSPAGLDLFLLREGDHRNLAATIRGDETALVDSAVTVVMIADYMDALVSYGAQFYRNLLWEAGMVGQVLRLEAARYRLLAIGSDGYRDDRVHDAFGMHDREWQSLYHFEIRAVGAGRAVSE